METPLRTRITSLLIVAFVVAGLIRLFGVEGFIVRGNSMAPTIKDGDYVFISKLAYRGKKEPRKNDVVVVVPRELPRKIIKRVMGMPGEKVDLGEGKSITLDPMEYYVFGDNKENSIDSRELGAVDKWDIKGRAFGAFRISSFKYIGL